MKVVKAIKDYKKRKRVLKLDNESLDKAVKIQGTQFDRKRKFTDKQVEDMKQLLSCGVDKKTVANKFNCSVHTMMYNTSEEYRRAEIDRRSGKHTGVTTMDFENRVNYKRQLVKKKLIDMDKVLL